MKDKLVAEISMIVLGAMLFFIGLWGGAYYLHLISINSWQVYPTILTILIVMGLGVIMVAMGSWYVEEKNL